MIIQEAVKELIPFNSSKDINVFTNKFKKELDDLQRSDIKAFREVAEQINTWLQGTNTTPMFEFKNRLTTGQPPRNIKVYGVQVRHRKPPIHALVFVEKKPTPPTQSKSKQQLEQQVGHIFTWHRLFANYDEYQRRAVNPGDALSMAQSYFGTGGN